MARIQLYACLLAALALAMIPTFARAQARPKSSFQVFLPATKSGSLTGRVFVFLSKKSSPEPRLEAGTWYSRTELVGKDAENLRGGGMVVLTEQVLGYPLASFRDLPEGDYFVQALFNVYTKFSRSDGHIIWAHDDHGEGQQFARSPGNLYSSVSKVHIGHRINQTVRLELDHTVPPLVPPEDTPWVKHVRVHSALLSAFWGQPVYLGATVLLPAGYASHPSAQYPILYEQGHFSRSAPLNFNDDPSQANHPSAGELQWTGEISGYSLYQRWISPDFPRIIVVTFQHPTVYYDDSYAVNSANDGPYGDAIMQELIPSIEEQFRVIRKPYARMLTGGSTGGWEALALQIFHPDFFGGAWSFYPDPVDFFRYQLVDIYNDPNAFETPGYEKPIPERPMERTVDGQTDVTVRQMSQLESVLGSHSRGGQQYSAWEAVYGPVAADGYPRPLWDKKTGVIDRTVALYMRDHGYDLRYYLQQHWPVIGPSLEHKLHIYCGDMDNFFLDVSVARLELFLNTTEKPVYGGTVEFSHSFKGHGWHALNQAALIEAIATQILSYAPASADISWRY